MRMRAKTAAFLSLWCLGWGTARADESATLNLQVRLDSGVIHVSDLWENAGQKGASVLGPAPPPGRAITVDTRQLEYIARLYSVNWKPISGVERSMVERAGRALTRDEILEPLKRSLVASGAAETATVELINVAPILVPPLSFPLLSVDGINYDPNSRRFSANVTVSAEGMQTQAVRVAGRVVQMIAAVVATRRLQADEVIGPTDIRVTEMPERGLSGALAHDPQRVIGKGLRRTIVAGQPIELADIGAPIMVAKGAMIELQLDMPGLSIAGQGIALGTGGRGDTIQVMNPSSRAVVAARVTGPGTAVVSPGSTPIIGPVGTTPRSFEAVR